MNARGRHTGSRPIFQWLNPSAAKKFRECFAAAAAAGVYLSSAPAHLTERMRDRRRPVIKAPQRPNRVLL